MDPSHWKPWHVILLLAIVVSPSWLRATTLTDGDEATDTVTGVVMVGVAAWGKEQVERWRRKRRRSQATTDLDCPDSRSADDSSVDTSRG